MTRRDGRADDDEPPPPARPSPSPPRSRSRASGPTRRLLAALATADPAPLEATAGRLGPEDLAILAGLTLAPHPRLHAAVAALHGALLSLAPSTPTAPDAPLGVGPWPLLRLELLSRGDAIWAKMTTRLAELRRGAPGAHTDDDDDDGGGGRGTHQRRQPGRQRQQRRRWAAAALSRAQVHFVLRLLVQGGVGGDAVAQAKDRDGHHDDADGDDDDHVDAGAMETEDGDALVQGLLGAFARVSAIAEALAAFVLLCVRYTLAPPPPPSSSSLSSSTKSPSRRPPPLALPPLPPVSSPAPASPSSPAAPGPRAPTSVTILRRGLKCRGRYVLLRVTAHRSRDGPNGGDEPARPWAWGLAVIERGHRRRPESESLLPTSAASSPQTEQRRRRSQRQRQREPASALGALGLLRGPVPPEIVRRCCGCRCPDDGDALPVLPRSATQALVLQSVLHEALHELSSSSLLPRHVPSVLRVPPPPLVVLLRVAIVSPPTPHDDNDHDDEALAHAHAQTPQLEALASVWIRDLDTTVADLQRALDAALAVTAPPEATSTSPSRGRVLWRGSFLPELDEAHVPARGLLPFALLGLDGPATSPHKPPRDRRRRRRRCRRGWPPETIPSLWALHADVARGLKGGAGDDANALLLPPPPGAQEQEAIAVSLLPLTPRRSSAAVAMETCERPTAAVLVDLFRNWGAVTTFHALQPATTVFRAQSEAHRRRQRRQRLRLLAGDIASDEHEADDDRRRRPEPTPEELALRQLPRGRFRPEREHLVPLYATLDVLSPTRARVTTPFPEHWRGLVVDVAAAAADDDGENDDDPGAKRRRHGRIVVADEAFVLHVTGIHATTTTTTTTPAAAAAALPQQLHTLEIDFARDASCELGPLLGLRGAYVWAIAPVDATSPPPWLRDIHRFVVHPTWDFATAAAPLTASPFAFFRVRVSARIVEGLVEAAFWSRDVDWGGAHLATCDVTTALVRPHFAALRAAFPAAASAIDSVKFSKFLRECGLQPRVLSVGDAAWLFASHRAPGSHYEMLEDGFVGALRRLAASIARARSPDKPQQQQQQQQEQRQLLPQAQAHSPRVLGPADINDDRDDDDDAALRRLVFEWLLPAPSVRGIWRELVVGSWRRREKLARMATAARVYCAATRLRAAWLRFSVRRRLLATLTWLKTQRHAAVAIQSLFRMRRARATYRQLRGVTLRVQRFVVARGQLRALRREFREHVERMRRRIVRWMRQRLRVLRCWKHLNALWLARRARIREKRGRRVAMGAFQLATRFVRVALYREPINADHGAAATAAAEASADAEVSGYTLEAVDPTTSGGFCLAVPRDIVVAASCPEPELLTTIVRRLHFRHHARRSQVARVGEGLGVYRAPQRTALGRLVFDGAVARSRRRRRHQPTADHRDRLDDHGDNRASDDDDDLDDQDDATGRGSVVLARLLVRGHVATLLCTDPTTSRLGRLDLPLGFIHRVLRVAHVGGLTLDDDDDDDDAEATAMAARRVVLEALQSPTMALGAMRHLLEYLERFGTARPTAAMLPEALAREAARRRLDRLAAERAGAERERALIVMVQARVRRRLARRALEALARRTYHREWDPARGALVYSNRLGRSGARAPLVLYATKPRSLGHGDVPEPRDEWLLLPMPMPHRTTTTCVKAVAFFNPLRGQLSALNDVLAARRLQRWFRRVRWAGLQTWDLRRLATALRFHQRPVLTAAAVGAGTGTGPDIDVDALVRGALRLHLLEHEFKGAQAAYEAALTLAPANVVAAVGLAVLLIYTCRYPIKQTWPRALGLLAGARAQDPELPTTLHEIEANGFSWALFLEPTSPHALGNFAVYQQCVRGDLDAAERLYRRAIDLDPGSDWVLANYIRLQEERTPEGLYARAGPGRIAIWRAQERRRLGASGWRELEDPGTRYPSARRFFHNLRTGECVWRLPPEATTPLVDEDEAQDDETLTSTSLQAGANGEVEAAADDASRTATTALAPAERD